MKRSFSVLVVLMLLSMVAFAGGQREADPAARLVGFAQVDTQNPWRLAETESVQSAAADRGYELIFVDGQANQANQIRALRSFIAQGVDGILLAPIVTTGWGPVLREAEDAGIPVVLLDRNIEETERDLVVTFIGSDFVWQGEQAAEQMIRDLGEGPLRIAELQGQPGADPTIERKRGFENVIDRYPNIEIIVSQTGQFNRAEGKQVMEAFLQSRGDEIDVVYAHNDDMAIGAIQAIREFGLNPGEDIYLISIDGVRDAFVAMMDGDLNATVESSPLMGPMGFDALEAAWRGEELPEWIKIDDETFTMDQAAGVIDSREY